MTGSPLTIGIDIGGTKVLGGVVDVNGVVLAFARRDTPADDVAKTLESIVEVVDELASAHEVSAVGIGAAGWLDADRSKMLFSANLAWRHEPLRERIAERLDRPVLLENDGNAAAWAEFRFGAAAAARDSMALVTVGTGIGGGVIVDGRVLRGANGMAAEMGHTRAVPGGRRCGCGRQGCFEQYCSGSALVRCARDRAVRDPESAARLLELAGDLAGIAGPVVTRAALDGDPASRAAFAEIGRWLGALLADMVQLLDPQILVIGGGVIEAGELLLAPTRAAYVDELAARASLPVASIVPARLGNTAGVVGVADLARLSLVKPA